jgi:hypothetical protein
MQKKAPETVRPARTVSGVWLHDTWFIKSRVSPPWVMFLPIVQTLWSINMPVELLGEWPDASEQRRMRKFLRKVIREPDVWEVRLAIGDENIVTMPPNVPHKDITSALHVQQGRHRAAPHAIYIVIAPKVVRSTRQQRFRKWSS